MKIRALASSVTTALVPLLPYLLKAGEKAAEETGKTGISPAGAARGRKLLAITVDLDPVDYAESTRETCGLARATNT